MADAHHNPEDLRIIIDGIQSLPLCEIRNNALLRLSLSHCYPPTDEQKDMSKRTVSLAIQSIADADMRRIADRLWTDATPIDINFLKDMAGKTIPEFKPKESGYTEKQIKNSDLILRGICSVQIHELRCEALRRLAVWHCYSSNERLRRQSQILLLDCFRRIPDKSHSSWVQDLWVHMTDDDMDLLSEMAGDAVRRNFTWLMWV